MMRVYGALTSLIAEKPTVLIILHQRLSFVECRRVCDINHSVLPHLDLSQTLLIFHSLGWTSWLFCWFLPFFVKNGPGSIKGFAWQRLNDVSFNAQVGVESDLVWCATWRTFTCHSYHSTCDVWISSWTKFTCHSYRSTYDVWMSSRFSTSVLI